MPPPDKVYPTQPAALLAAVVALLIGRCAAKPADPLPPPSSRTGFANASWLTAMTSLFVMIPSASAVSVRGSAPITSGDLKAALCSHKQNLSPSSAKTPKHDRENSGFRIIVGLFSLKPTSLRGHHSRFGTNHKQRLSPSTRRGGCICRSYHRLKCAVCSSTVKPFT